MTKITRTELNFIREAMQEKFDSLMKVIDFVDFSQVSDTGWQPVKSQPIPEPAAPEVTKVKKVRQVKAPWGYKKDGTPKKKPGVQAGF